jgi:hypothetical protein
VTRPHSAAAAALAIVLAACGSHQRNRPVSVRRPSRLHAFIQANVFDRALDAALRGPLSLVQIAGVHLELNPSLHDPITAFGACADLVTHCYNPPSLSLDQCVAGARVCETTTPWNEPACCPVACRDGYQLLRAEGIAPMSAFERVYLEGGTCMPGVSGMVAAQR